MLENNTLNNDSKVSTPNKDTSSAFITDDDISKLSSNKGAKADSSHATAMPPNSAFTISKLQELKPIPGEEEKLQNKNIRKGKNHNFSLLIIEANILT